MLIRVILIALIIYLLGRQFARFLEDQSSSSRKSDNEDKGAGKNRGVSKEVGEYVDYEEIKDEK
jgi:hypothetical protein